MGWLSLLRPAAPDRQTHPEGSDRVPAHGGHGSSSGEGSALSPCSATCPRVAAHPPVPSNPAVLATQLGSSLLYPLHRGASGTGSPFGDLSSVLGKEVKQLAH